MTGYVDHHAHLLRVAAGARPPYDFTDPASIRAWHQEVASQGGTPMDVPPEPTSAPDLATAFDHALLQAADLGLVEITEAGLRDPAHLDALQQLRERGPLPLRVRILVASGAAGPDTLRRTGDEWLEVVGVKFYADGWLGPRTCALHHPFDDDPANEGVLFLDAATLARRAEPFAAEGWTVATHAIGDRAIEAVLDAYEMVYGDGCAAAAPRIEHAQVLHPDLVARMAALGVVACIQPSFAVSDAETAAAALGPRAEHAYDWAALLDAGVRVVTGSDYPIEPLDPAVGLEHLSRSLPRATALALMTGAG